MIDAVDIVVGFEDVPGEFSVAFDKRPQRVTDHGPDFGRHGRNIDWQFRGGKLDHVQHALRDIDRLVAHALEVGVNFQDRENEPQVDGHRLLHGQKIDGKLVHFALSAVDGVLVVEHALAQSGVALRISLH